MVIAFASEVLAAAITILAIWSTKKQRLAGAWQHGKRHRPQSQLQLAGSTPIMRAWTMRQERSADPAFLPALSRSCHVPPERCLYSGRAARGDRHHRRAGLFALARRFFRA